MNKFLSLKIAIRFFLGRKKIGIASLISSISIIGIILVITILIISLSIMNGFERELNNQILSAIPHGEIEFIKSIPSDWKKKAKQIEKMPGISSVFPYVKFTGIIEHKNKLQIVQIQGIDFYKEKERNKLYNCKNFSNKNNIFYKEKGIIIGKDISDLLDIKKGDWITIVIPNFNSKVMELFTSRRIQLQVIEFLEFNKKLNCNFGIVSIENAQKILNIKNNISGFFIKVDNIFNSEKLVKNASEKINSFVKVKNWMNDYGNIYKDIQMVRSIIYFSMTIMIGIAFFNIASVLTIIVKDKNVDIAILRTLGITKKTISYIFLWYSILVSLLSSIIGILFGIFISINLTNLIKFIEYLLNRTILSKNIFFINFLPVELHFFDIFIVLLITLIISTLVSYYPSKRASSICPIIILTKRK